MRSNCALSIFSSGGIIALLVGFETMYASPGVTFEEMNSFIVCPLLCLKQHF